MWKMQNLRKSYFEFQSIVLSTLLRNWVNLLVSKFAKNARTCKGAFPETRLFNGKHCEAKHTVWKTRKKLPTCSVQWLLLANWQFWWWQGFKCFQLQCHTGLEGKLRKLNRFPGLACCCWSWSVDCGGPRWKWLTVTPPSPSIPCWENRESIQSQQAKQPFLLSTPALNYKAFLRTAEYLFYGHQLWIRPFLGHHLWIRAFEGHQLWIGPFEGNQLLLTVF